MSQASAWGVSQLMHHYRCRVHKQRPLVLAGKGSPNTPFACKPNGNETTAKTMASHMIQTPPSTHHGRFRVPGRAHHACDLITRRLRRAALEREKHQRRLQFSVEEIVKE